MNVSAINKVVPFTPHRATHPDMHIISSLITAFKACIDGATLLHCGIPATRYTQSMLRQLHLVYSLLGAHDAQGIVHALKFAV